MIIKNSRPIVRMSKSFHSREAALYPMLELATPLVVLPTLLLQLRSPPRHFEFQSTLSLCKGSTSLADRQELAGGSLSRPQSH